MPDPILLAVHLRFTHHRVLIRREWTSVSALPIEGVGIGAVGRNVEDALLVLLARWRAAIGGCDA